jgi:hypothetical protein
MKLSIKRKWIANLKSGKYKQGKRALKQEISKEFFYCCLGVLAEQVHKEKFTKTLTYSLGGDFRRYFLFDNSLTSTLPDWFWIKLEVKNYKEIQNQLIDMNDVYNMTFVEIAEWIQLNL